MDQRTSRRGGPQARVEFVFHEAGEILEALNGLGGELTRPGVDHAQRSDAFAIHVEDREPGIEADARFADDERIFGKPIIHKRVLHYQGRTTQDRVSAKGHLA